MYRIIRKIFSLAGSFAGKMKASVIFSFLNGIFSTVTFYAVLYFCNALFKQNTTLLPSYLKNTFIILAVGLIGDILTRYAMFVLQGEPTYHMVTSERLNMVERLRRVPMGFFHKNAVSDISMALTTDLKYIESMSPIVLDWIINGTITAFVSCICLLIFEWRMGLIFCGGLLASLYVMGKMLEKGNISAPRIKKAQSKATGATLEFVQGIATFKLYRMSGESTTKLKNTFEQYRKESYDAEIGFVPWSVLFKCILNFASGLIFVLAPYLAMKDILSVPAAIMMVIAAFRIFRPVLSLGSAAGSIRMLEVTLDKVSKLRDFPLIDEDSKDIILTNHDIKFEDVSFGYEKHHVIHNVSFQLPEKSMTAVIGPSSCGKTTLTRLIARFWDVNEGSITIGGVDIKNITCDSLLSNISMVFQNVYLFNDTILNNIKAGNPNASMETIYEAAKKARCHEFIIALPDGYHTMVGEGGTTLSGGEKQRISIARAILKDSPIILLDEATSSIDPENERSIQTALDALVKDKTLIIIAHRLPTIENADQILVMNEGHLVQSGNHQELIKEEGQYKRFWEIRKKATNWKLS